MLIINLYNIDVCYLFLSKFSFRKCNFVFQAIDSKQHGEYKVKVLCPVINADAEKLQLKNIPAISTLHNFEFTDTGLTVWRGYATGPG